MDDNQDTNGSGKWFWIGAEFKDLPPVLKQKFVDSRHSRYNSLASVIKRGLNNMEPGDVKGFGPLANKRAAEKVAARISSLASKTHWAEGFTCGIIEDDEGKWWASIMRKIEEPET